MESLIASLIAIIAFFSGRQSIGEFLSNPTAIPVNPLVITVVVSQPTSLPDPTSIQQAYVPPTSELLYPTYTPYPTLTPYPTAIPPTSVPPTAIPPTAVPPTAIPPTAVPPTAIPQIPITGIWAGTGYKCGGVDYIERVQVQDNGNSYYVASKLDGDICVGSGSPTWEGTYSNPNNSFPLSFSVKVWIKDNNGQLVTVDRTAYMPNANRIEIQMSSYLLIFTR